MRYRYIVFFLSLLPFSGYSHDSLWTQQEIIYGHKHGLASTMIMVKPANANGKAIISIISGNWVSNYNSYSRTLEGARPFLDAGYTVFFTLHSSAPLFDITVAIADIKRAVQFIRYNAKAYTIDPDNIGITGTSSGGHLALVAGTSDDIINSKAKDPVEKISSKVQAVAAFAPPADFTNWGKAGWNPMEQKALLQMMGLSGAFEFKQFDSSKLMYTVVEDKEKLLAIAKAISPAVLVTADDAPTYIMHGDKDRVVPLQQSQLIEEKLQSAKVPVVLIIKTDAGHIWKDMVDDRKEFVKWFDKYLKRR